MTIAAGFRFSDGVLLCADTQLTVSGYYKLSGSKIVSVDFAHNGGSKVAFAITGSVAHAHMAIEHCCRSLSRKPEHEMTSAEMAITIEDEIQSFFDDHIFRHPGFNQGTLAVQFLIASWSHIDKQTTIMATQDNAVTRVSDYECLGAGAFLAHYLVPTIFRHSAMGLDDAVHVATHVLRETKRYTDTCGGGSEMIVLRKDGRLSDVAYADIESGETMSQMFREATKRLFIVASDLRASEEELRKEFDQAFFLMNQTRKQLLTERENMKNLREALSKVQAAHMDRGIDKR